MKILTILIMLVAAISVDAQLKKFKWPTEMCEFEGTYDSKKYTEKQLNDTKRLLFDSDLRLSSIGATVWKYEDIAKIDVADLDARYKKVKAELESLDYIKNAYTNKRLAERLKETDQIYALARPTMLAYEKPEVLRDVKGVEACKKDFGEPLIAGGDSLLAAWKRVNEESRTKNGDPNRLKTRFENEMASPDRLKFALVETMSFGWWNCANGSIEYISDGFSEEIESEFKKFFKTTKTISCDEP